MWKWLGELIEKHVNSVACTILLCTTHGHFAKTEEEKETLATDSQKFQQFVALMERNGFLNSTKSWSKSLKISIP